MPSKYFRKVGIRNPAQKRYRGALAFPDLLRVKTDTEIDQVELEFSTLPDCGMGQENDDRLMVWMLDIDMEAAWISAEDFYFDRWTRRTTRLSRPVFDFMYDVFDEPWDDYGYDSYDDYGYDYPEEPPEDRFGHDMRAGYIFDDYQGPDADNESFYDEFEEEERIAARIPFSLVDSPTRTELLRSYG